MYLPAHATQMLKKRRDEQEPNALDAVFASHAGTWVSPGNFTTRLQRAFAAYPELKGVTPKVFRSTVATELNNRAEGGMDTAKSQLGHASSMTTEKHYVVRAVAAPDVSCQTFSRKSEASGAHQEGQSGHSAPLPVTQ